MAGRIALVGRGGLPFREKALNAMAAGASGVIAYNNEEGRIVGNLNGELDILAAGIGQADGEALLARLATETVMASITVTDATATSFNVVAKPKGIALCDTVTGGHYDTVPVTGGADDNASGTAAVLETARVIAARKTTGAHCFVLFGAEEIGLFGSKAYVAQMSDAELNALRAMVNLDVVGLPQELELIGSEDLVSQAGLIAEGMDLPWRPSFVPSGLGSDHLSFRNAGVPVVFLYRDDTLIHTQEDAIGRISVESLAQTVEVAAALLAELGE
jgi:aminopeptidase YwaD